MNDVAPITPETLQPLRVSEVAGMLGVSDDQVRTYIHKGLLRAFNLGAGKHSLLMIPRDDVVRFLQERMVGEVKAVKVVRQRKYEGRYSRQLRNRGDDGRRKK